MRPPDAIELAIVQAHDGQVEPALASLCARLAAERARPAPDPRILARLGRACRQGAHLAVRSGIPALAPSARDAAREAYTALAAALAGGAIAPGSPGLGARAPLEAAVLTAVLAELVNASLDPGPAGDAPYETAARLVADALRGRDNGVDVAWAIATGQARAAGRAVPESAEALWAAIAASFEAD